ncbi:MAG TPA: dihydrofolate reductase [Rhizobiaceae bacterium]|nr:dihydrofolate reductase [Rhizobiaceae bacterium]
MDIAIYVAIAENGVIGRDGGLPWRLSSDLKRLKADTMGKPIIMGRRTYDSIGKPLPGRLNIVVTRNRDWGAEGVEAAASLDEAIRLAEDRAHSMPGADEIIILGGGMLYAEALVVTDKLYVTHVLASVDGDTTFPEIDPAVWEIVSSLNVPAGEKDDYPTRHVIYRRRSGRG